MRVLWSAAAQRALAAAKTYIANDDPAAAQRVERRILDRVAALARMPYIGRPGRRPGTRELSIPDVRYLIVYRIRDDEILILMLWHSRQSQLR
jgi:addiction module RelE/StbE family toxin